MTTVLPLSAFCMTMFLFLMRVFKELNSSDERLFSYLQLSFKSLCENSLCEKLLSVTIDSKLSFNAHLDKILTKARQKVQVLARIAPYMSIPKRKLIMNSFFTSQFNYCPLVWMCHSRSMNSKTSRLNETCLHIIYNDKSSSFEELLEKDKSVTIHVKHIQKLATEMFKVFKNLSPPIVANLFEVRQNDYNLKHRSYFSIPNVKSVYHG